MKLVITIANTNEVIGFEYDSKEALETKLRDSCKQMSTYRKSMDDYIKEGKELSEMLQSKRSNAGRITTYTKVKDDYHRDDTIVPNLQSKRSSDTYDEMLERVKYIESELALLHELCKPYYWVYSPCKRYAIPVYTHKSHGYGYSAPLMETAEEYIARLFKEKE